MEMRLDVAWKASLPESAATVLVSGLNQLSATNVVLW